MKKTFILTMTAFTLASCSFQESINESTSGENEELPTAYVQDSGQLYLPESEFPLNYGYQTGIWYPYMHFDEYMYGKTEDEFRNAVRERFSSAKSEGFNTVYIHVHPCGDAYYKSDIFPRGTYFDGDYDPLEIMTEEAHKLQLSIHAWLNPLRCQTIEQMSGLPDSFIIKQWADDPECHYAEIVGGRWYLDPAYPEVRQLVADCAGEIINKYSVDGIHIDDYFYPTSEPEFDEEAFLESGFDDLDEWRITNCSLLVKELYDTVKSCNDKLLFGISPQGNISADYNSQYADVKRWGSESGFCDYIVPQLYFGFENETCPFEETLREWENLVTNENISLIIGIGAYKLGKTDQWAGAAGEQEWIENPDIIERQIAMVKYSSAKGYALYF